MAFKVIETSLPGVMLIQPQVFEDQRGYFLETFNQKRYAQAGLYRAFMQDNHSHSRRHVVRGLHYQLKNPQGKMVYVVQGEIFDVAVDIRRGSPTFGKWVGAHLTEENHQQLFIPEGFAHGLCVVSETADVIYKCTDIYVPGDDYGILWSDESIGIDWPISYDLAVVSEKDQKNPRLGDVTPDQLPVYKG